MLWTRRISSSPSWPGSPKSAGEEKVIGRVFDDVFKREAKSITDAKFLAQGTLAPDIVEDGGSPDGPAATIKLHHNVGGLPAELGFNLIEPGISSRTEFAAWGSTSACPRGGYRRHPFPGCRGLRYGASAK
ncbi:MAG: hypothetical protein U0792_08060 [Gemmataceae bacterium]